MHDCVFCKIVAGTLPSHKVYEDELVLAFLDIHPVHPGHTLVIPKHHALNIFDVSQNDWSAMTETARILAKAIERATGADGINVMMNNREHAGQVVDHAHIHLIPRFKNDGLKLWHHTDYKNDEAESVKEKIRAALN